MEKIRIMTIVGTRPEAVKLAPLIKEFDKQDAVESIVCIAAQDRKMLDQVLDIFKIEPHYDLNIASSKQTLSSLASKVLDAVDGMIREVQPDLILVHGDTTITFAVSLAAFYNKVKLGHIDSGIRSIDKNLPHPEEMNRKLTSMLSDMHFAPTSTWKRNLMNEGIKEHNIYVTGNTAIDALSDTIDDQYSFESADLNEINFMNQKVIMVTAHRRENWGEPLENLCRALKRIALSNSDVEIVYAVHMNALIKDTVYAILSEIPNVHLVPPLDLKSLHNLLNRCYMVISDSGGLQEIAPHLGKPLLLLRGATERPEAIAAGTVKTVGTDEERIFEEAIKLLHNKESYNRMATATNPYGDGKATKRILDAIFYEFGVSDKEPEDFHSKR